MNAPLRVFRFPGGLHLDGHKALSARQPITAAPLPPALILPLSQHIGGAAKPCVAIGDQVRRGQTIAEAQGAVSAPVHAPTSGTISAIEMRVVPHPSGLMAPCIILTPDGQDRPLDAPEWTPLPDYHQAAPDALRTIVRRAGIVGLGGAGFPAAIKLTPGRAVDTLIVNGAECEPYITCDQMLMQTDAAEIVLGIQVALHALEAPRCLIGIEDNKPDAIRALSDAAHQDPRIHVVVVPTRYPQGGEKQLIQTLTGREVPSEGLPLDLGIVCHNPGTLRAIGQAVTRGEPLIERVITVTGEAIAHPQNFRVRLGTPMQFLVDLAGGFQQAPASVLMGGPMMGFRLPDLSVPVVKASNCLLALPAEQVRDAAPAQPCIRCGECATVCPAQLLPQQLYWHARAREFDRAEALNLFDCIECGCCALVCPSHIPLVQYYRFAKTEIWTAEADKRQADAARVRHEARQARLEREEAEKEAARARRKAALAARKGGDSTPAAPEAQTAADSRPAAPAAEDPVAKALARAQARKAAGSAVPQPASVDAEPEDPVAKALAAAQARKAAKAKADVPAERPSTAEDPVAKALAAAQARKAAKATAPPGNDQSDPAADDPVARAIAAAKARKAAKAGTAVPAEAPSSAEDPVAKALAAAQARKAAKATAPPPEDQSAPVQDDPVATAIAAAKARKAAKAGAPPESGEGPPADDDPVARALAAARARKAAKAAAASPDEGQS